MEVEAWAGGGCGHCGGYGGAREALGGVWSGSGSGSVLGGGFIGDVEVGAVVASWRDGEVR